MATRKVRYKKLNVKTLLPVLREDEIDASEYDNLNGDSQIATGVEQAEEKEYHLQEVLQTSGTSADKEIPVPPPQESDLNYDELYPVRFNEPHNYIRFSQTVEECIGCLYDMTEDDDVFLKSYNQDRAAGAQLSEDDFESFMEVFEETAAIETPFSKVDNTVILYDLMIPGLNELDNPKVTMHAKALYEYWKSERQAKNGRLHPSLKFETSPDSDDMDPFICFRRREVRQTRKTRQKDVQSADKLKRLRKELEEGRDLILLAHKREVLKRDMLLTDKAVYEAREKIKRFKVKLDIKADDEDLYTTKPQRKKPVEVPPMQRPPAGPLRVLPRPDGRSAAESDLALLSDQLAEKENELRLDVENKIEHHRKWNLNHVDLTNDSMKSKPVPNQPTTGYRPAKVQYLMTPPNSASASVEDLGEPEPMDLDPPEPSVALPPVVPPPPPSRPAAQERRAMATTPAIRFQGLPEDDEEFSPRPREFRRRMGRNSRVWLDRRDIKGLSSPPQEQQQQPSYVGQSDQWKYDDDSSDDDDLRVTEMDPNGLRALKFRATIPLGMTPGLIAPRQRIEAPMPNGVPPNLMIANGVGPAGGRHHAPQGSAPAAPGSQLQNGT